jgi:multidrug efflux system membrane fusion protein
VTANTGNGSAEQGKLRFIDSAVDMTTGTVKLKAVFDNPRRQLWPGEFVNVRAQLAMEQNRIVVPTQTVQTGPNGKYVWVMGADSTVNMRPVTVMRTSGENSVIESGLKSGEMVISEGQMRLAPGAKVQVLKPAEAHAAATPPAGG